VSEEREVNGARPHARASGHTPSARRIGRNHVFDPVSQLVASKIQGDFFDASVLVRNYTYSHYVDKVGLSLSNCHRNSLALDGAPKESSIQ
jgi:hypothetical protein